jgi:hypothetical protein
MKPRVRSKIRRLCPNRIGAIPQLRRVLRQKPAGFASKLCADQTAGRQARGRGSRLHVPICGPIPVVAPPLRRVEWAAQSVFSLLHVSQRRPCRWPARRSGFRYQVITAVCNGHSPFRTRACSAEAAMRDPARSRFYRVRKDAHPISLFIAAPDVRHIPVPGFRCRHHHDQPHPCAR